MQDKNKQQFGLSFESPPLKSPVFPKIGTINKASGLFQIQRMGGKFWIFWLSKRFFEARDFCWLDFHHSTSFFQIRYFDFLLLSNISRWSLSKTHILRVNLVKPRPSQIPAYKDKLWYNSNTEIAASFCNTILLFTIYLCLRLNLEFLGRENNLGFCWLAEIS